MVEWSSNRTKEVDEKMDEFSIIAILTVSIAVGKFVSYLHTARTKKVCKWLSVGVALAVNAFAFLTIPVPKPEVYPAGGILNSYSQGIFINSTSNVLTPYYTTDSITDPKFGQKYTGPFSIDRPRTIIAKNKFLFRWSEATIIQMSTNEDSS